MWAVKPGIGAQAGGRGSSSLTLSAARHRACPSVSDTPAGGQLEEEGRWRTAQTGQVQLWLAGGWAGWRLGWLAGCVRSQQPGESGAAAQSCCAPRARRSAARGSTYDVQQPKVAGNPVAQAQSTRGLRTAYAAASVRLSCVSQGQWSRGAAAQTCPSAPVLASTDLALPFTDQRRGGCTTMSSFPL